MMRISSIRGKRYFPWASATHGIVTRRRLRSRRYLPGSTSHCWLPRTTPVQTNPKELSVSDMTFRDTRWQLLFGIKNGVP